MRLNDVLALPSLEDCRVVGGRAGLDRDVGWVHVIDIPRPAAWSRKGQLVLTTGAAWPRDGRVLRQMLRSFEETGVAAIGLAVPQFFDAMPTEVIDEAQRLGLPVIEVPWEIPFAQITEDVHRALLGEQARLLERSEVIHRVLTRAAGMATSLEDIAGTLARELAHEVAFLSPHGDVLAYTGGETVATDLLRRAVATRLGDDDHRADARVVGPETMGPDTWAVTCGLRVQDRFAGTVWVIGDEPPTHLEKRAAEHAAVVAALHLAHRRALATVESRLRRSFIDDLLEGRIDASTRSFERGHVAGFSNRGSYRVLLAELDVELPLGLEAFERREAALERVRQLLLRRGESELLTAASNRIYVLLHETFPAEDVWRALDEPEARVVVGRAHRGIVGVRAGFHEVRASLRYVPKGRSARYEELLLPRALEGDVEAQHALVASYEEPLAGSRNGSRLVDTLFALAAQEFELKATAEALGIHVSTLRYRLERIEERAAIDLHDPEARFRLRVAAYVRERHRDAPI